MGSEGGDESLNLAETLYLDIRAGSAVGQRTQRGSRLVREYWPTHEAKFW